MKLYALHDKKACALSSFHVERSDAVATRGFADAVLAKDSVFGKYADDFELVSLCDVSQDYEGQFSDAECVCDVAHRVIVTARQVVDMQPKADGQLSLLKEA